jgi:hypothetical protein
MSEQVTAKDLTAKENARVRKSFDTEVGEAGRDVLKFAARFSAILVIASA